MIATALGLLLYLSAILVTGHVLVSLILGREKRRRSECIGLVLALGVGALQLILFWASLAGLKPGRILIAFVLSISAAVQWQLSRSNQNPWLPNERHALVRGWRNWLRIACIATVAVAVLMVTLDALALPILEWDAFAIWGLKAKVLARETLLAQPRYFHDPNLSFSHLDYPLFVPFLMAGAHGAMGEANEYLGKIAFPILYVAFGLQIFSALRWKLDATKSLLLTAVAMTLPPLLHWAGAGTADVPLALYYAGAAFYFAKWIEEQHRADLLLSIFYSACLAFTKNEGFVLALLIGGAMLLFALLARSRTQLRGFAFFTGGLLLLHSPWLWWSRNLPRIHENYGARLRPFVFVQNFDRLGVIAHEFLREMLAWSRWSGVWLLLLVAGIAGWRAFTLRFVRALWLLLLVQLTLYIAIFVVTPWDVAQLLAAALERLLVQAIPLAVVLIGFHWATTIPPPVPRS
jgi:hypothetical protein